MKNFIRLTTVLSITILFFACNNDNDDYNNWGSNQNESSDVILKERDRNLPEVVTRKMILEHKPTARANGVDEGKIGNSDILLGYSYTIGSSIIGEYNNVLLPVVDVKKVKEVDASYVDPKYLNTNFTHSFAYSNFERYETNSTVTKKVSSGVSLNLGVFKIG